MKASRENLVVLRGALAAEPQERTLPTGSVAVQFDVRTTLGDAGDRSGGIRAGVVDRPVTRRPGGARSR